MIKNLKPVVFVQTPQGQVGVVMGNKMAYIYETVRSAKELLLEEIFDKPLTPSAITETINIICKINCTLRAHGLEDSLSTSRGAEGITVWHSEGDFKCAPSFVDAERAKVTANKYYPLPRHTPVVRNGRSLTGKSVIRLKELAKA